MDELDFIEIVIDMEFSILFNLSIPGTYLTPSSAGSLLSMPGWQTSKQHYRQLFNGYISDLAMAKYADL